MKINLNRFLGKASHYLFALAIILECRSIWTVTRGMGWFNYFNILMLAAALLCCMLFNKVRAANFKNAAIVAGSITIYLLLFWILDSYKTLTFIRQILILVICIFYSILFGRKEGKKSLFNSEEANPFWICYENIMIVVACVSLFFWMFGSCLGYIQPTGHIWSTWSTAKDTYVASYFDLYFETQSWESVVSIMKFRNTAIFTEAPMASLHFSIALLVELFIREKNRSRNLIILTIAIISTFSTTGYIIIILAYFAKLFFKKEKKSYRWIIKNLIVMIGLIVGVCLIQFLIDQKLDSASGSIRLDDFSAGFKAWTDHPLLGNGYGNGNAILHYISGFRRNNTGFSNSPMYILALGGLYLFILFSLAAIKGICRMISSKDWNSLSFYALFLALFTITLIPFNGLTYIMFCMMGNYMKQHLAFSKFRVQDRSACTSGLGGLK